MNALVNIQNTSATVRFYSPGAVFGDPYIAVATIQYLGPETIFISGLHGSITKSMLTELAKQLDALGYKEALIIRHGKLKIISIARYIRYVLTNK